MGIGKQLTALAGALAVCFALGACGGTAGMAEQGNVITVHASAEVRVEPDKASFNVSIVTQGSTAEEASAANAEPVNAVIETLKEAGVADENIQTVNTDLSPRYGSADESEVAAIYLHDGSDIVGYEMNTVIEVTGVGIDEVAELMGACVSAGATGVDGPRYYVSSYDEAYAEALAEAVASSREKAQVMADAAGVALGRVVAIAEDYSYFGYRYSAADTAASAEVEGGLGDMDIEPGQVSIEAQVTVSYSI